MGEEIDAECRDVREGGRGGDGGDVFVRESAGGEERAVFELFERDAVAGGEDLGLERGPWRGRGASGFPCGDGGGVFGGGEDGGVAACGGVAEGGPEAALTADVRVRIEVDVAFADAGEDGLDGEVVFLGDGVEFVGVAACAVGGGADEGAHRLGDEVIAVEVFEAGDGGASGADVVGSGTEEAEGGGEVGFVREADVGGELFADEAWVWSVGVEGGDDVVAEAPCVFAFHVVFEAVGIGEVDDV